MITEPAQMGSPDYRRALEPLLRLRCAVSRWRELRPDVILIIRLKCGDDRRPWIIAPTAGALAEERTASLAAGMNDFITKPLTGTMRADALKRAQAETGG